MPGIWPLIIINRKHCKKMFLVPRPMYSNVSLLKIKWLPDKTMFQCKYHNVFAKKYKEFNTNVVKMW